MRPGPCCAREAREAKWKTNHSGRLAFFMLFLETFGSDWFLRHALPSGAVQRAFWEISQRHLRWAKELHMTFT